MQAALETTQLHEDALSLQGLCGAFGVLELRCRCEDDIRHYGT